MTKRRSFFRRTTTFLLLLERGRIAAGEGLVSGLGHMIATRLHRTWVFRRSGSSSFAFHRMCESCGPKLYPRTWRYSRPRGKASLEVGVVKTIHRVAHFYYPRFWASKTAKWLWRVQKFAVFFTLFEHIWQLSLRYKVPPIPETVLALHCRYGTI